MEKSWENFWTTGKVDDYLTYRNKVSECDVCRKQENMGNAQQDNRIQQNKTYLEDNREGRMF